MDPRPISNKRDRTHLEDETDEHGEVETFDDGDGASRVDLAADSPGTKKQKKKRGRHAVACVACHRRKQRCDGDLPCFNCARRNLGASCTYPNSANDAARTPHSASDSHVAGVLATMATGDRGSSSRYDVSAPDVPSRGASTQLLEEARSEPHTAEASRGPSPAPLAAGVQDNRRRHNSGIGGNEYAVGDLFKTRDAPTFFGSSYFGPQVAAKIIKAPAPVLSSGFPLSGAAGFGSMHGFGDGGGTFSQVWDLLGLLPREKATVDRLTECFLCELNWAIDAVEPQDFRQKYDTFWSTKFEFTDLSTIDLRWLGLLFIVIAFGVLLDNPKPRNKDAQREIQETSLRFYWAARRSVVIAPTFYGESIDIVRTAMLTTRYLIYSRRVPESWLTTSFGMRMGQAQGMHIDGERWRLSRQKTEARRRLWSHMYVLDKTIALGLGRPVAIMDQQCLIKLASNVWLDDMSEADAETASEQPLTEPTMGLGSRLAHELAMIIGKIQERCFGLFKTSYDAVLALEEEIAAWETALPEYFRVDNPDLSKDETLPWLVWTRLFLHSMYHFARVTLHRPFLLRQSITDRYRVSREACISSACADLDMRLSSFRQTLGDRMKWILGPHHCFNSALVLGITAVRDPLSRRSQAILEDLTAYCELQRRDIWVNDFALAEVKIVELCVNKARQIWTAAQAAASEAGHAAGMPGGEPIGNVPPLPVPAASVAGLNGGMGVGVGAGVGTIGARSIPLPHVYEQGHSHVHGTRHVPVHPGFSAPPDASSPGFNLAYGPIIFDEEPFAFPATDDLLRWEHVLDSIMQDQVNSNYDVLGNGNGNGEGPSRLFDPSFAPPTQ